MATTKWVTGAAVLACLGALVACGPASGAAPGTARPSDAVPFPTVTSTTTTTTEEPTVTGSAEAPTAQVGDFIDVLSGRREVAVVRVQAAEGGLALDGQLVEADDDSGRQLFVPTPLGGDKYLIKTYRRVDNHPANDEPACWQENGSSGPRTISGALCDADNPRQQFTITHHRMGGYAISNEAAFLQLIATNGLMLEELGDAPLLSTFRFVDNGPARKPAGG